MSRLYLKYLTNNGLEQLKSNINNNIDNYLMNEPWLERYFGEKKWGIESRINPGEINLIVEPGERGKNDFENAKRIYLALNNLTLTQASDERLWSYLTHVVFWDYMKVRWPVENKIESSKVANFIKSRYFLSSGRHTALVRNGISRLWWAAYVSYDQERENPFELTELMLSKQDIPTSFLERLYSNNKQFIIATLSALKKIKDNFPTFQSKDIQAIGKHIQRIGGVTILDTLNENDMENVLLEWADNYFVESA